MTKNKKNVLPLNTEIEVISMSKGNVYKKIMSYGDALNIDKKKGFTYSFYQVGYSSYKDVIEIK